MNYQSEISRLWRKVKTLERCKASCSSVDSSGWWETFDVTYEDFATASNTNTIVLRELATDEMVFRAVVMPTEEFAGGGITAYTIALGNSAVTNNLYQSATSAFTGITVNTANNHTIAPTRILAASSNITATATTASVMELLNAATTGAATVFVQIAKFR